MDWASADTLTFKTGGSEKVRITSTGNVGIGTTSVGSPLEVYGTSMDPSLTPSETSIFNINSLGVELAIGRMVTPPHSIWLQGKHATVTGSLTYPIVLNPLGGNVGIGTTAPNATLHVSGSSGATATFQGSTQSTMNLKVGSFDNYLVGTSTGDISIRPSGSTAVTILSGGNVGIGETSPTYKLHVNGDLRAGAGSFLGSVTGTKGIFSDASGVGSVLEAYNTVATNATTAIIRQTTAGGNGNQDIGLLVDIQGANDLDRIANFRYYDGSTYTSRMVIMRGGNVGIGTAAPAAKLEISGSSNSVLLNIKSAISGAILYVSGSGAVGIGTSNVGAYTLQVSGSFAATTKSFVIEHPTKAGKKLIYGSLESPYHGIRLTGRDTLVNGKCKIQLPDYMYKLILHDSVNIQLTGIKCNKTLYIDDINIPENYFTIAYDKTVFESYKDYDFFWDFTGIRADVPELQTEM
jgi:hypothetical protein